MLLDRLQALYDWLHTHEGRKVFRYSMVSVISTAVSLFVIFIVYGVLSLWTEVPSTIFGNAVATFPSYWLNRKWAWGKGGRSHLLKEVLPFWIASAAGIAFAIIWAALARHIALKYQLSHVETTLLVMVANVMSFGIFWILKLLLFNKLFHQELNEFDERLTYEEEHEGLDQKDERHALDQTKERDQKDKREALEQKKEARGVAG